MLQGPEAIQGVRFFELATVKLVGAGNGSDNLVDPMQALLFEGLAHTYFKSVSVWAT